MANSISEEEQILAAGYVLGHLTASEITQFETVLANNPDLQAEVDALQSTYHQLPQTLPLYTPPPDLKVKIIESFAAASIANPITTLTLEPPKPTVAAITPAARPAFDWGKILTGIGLLVGGLLAFDNFNLRQELQVAQQVNAQELASVLNQPKSRLLALTTQEDRIVGNILFTPGNWQQIIISAKDLPPLPVDRVYRMWLELANGQVIPCGEFKTDDRNRIFIKLTATQKPPTGVNAKGVFITIDKHTDPLQPTGQRVIQGTI
jgi:Anti-sigma-K factor rskA